jgi:hypothetical protein
MLVEIGSLTPAFEMTLLRKGDVAMKCRNCLLVINFTIIVLLMGCGYHFTSGGENIDQSIRTVYVASFSNRTSEAHLENMLRSAFIEQFRKSSRFELADRREEADAVLRGSVNSLSFTHLSYSSADVAREDRATVTMELIFEEREDRKIIWSNPAFSWYGDFPVTQTDTLKTDISRQGALNKLSADLANRAYRLMMSGF